jgi:gamma-glutamyltranspeptidase/glutathione hydrolase
MLLKGGNAVDAALATAITLTVVEPTSNGLGSDAFSIVWDGKKLHGLNASGRAPKSITPSLFKGMTKMPTEGWGPVTVPGAVSAWTELSKKFGKLDFAELFEPAIEYASHGYIVTPITASVWKTDKDRYTGFPEFAQTFLPGGRAPEPGEMIVLKDHAKSLCRIAATKGEAFYRGDLAEKIAAHAKTTGGYMTLEDLAEHKADWVEPISIDYRDVALHEIPPNGQGIAALIMLGIIRHQNIQQYPVDSADSFHIQIEAMKLAFADAYRYVADPLSMKVGVGNLLNPDYLKKRSKMIDLNKANSPSYGVFPKDGTVYLTAADENGMMVSYIQSNYMGFGSGIVIPGTGIAMQNRGACFSLEDGHPNIIGGGKRPFHTIIPAFVTRDGKPLMSFGVMGGSFQPQGHSQMMIRIYDYGQNPQTASDAPRWQVLKDLDIAVEPGFSPSVLEELRNRGHRIKIGGSEQFGGAQLIYRLDDGYCAGSDRRKDGQAVGF